MYKKDYYEILGCLMESGRKDLANNLVVSINFNKEWRDIPQFKHPYTGKLVKFFDLPTDLDVAINKKKIKKDGITREQALLLFNTNRKKNLQNNLEQGKITKNYVESINDAAINEVGSFLLKPSELKEWMKFKKQSEYELRAVEFHRYKELQQKVKDLGYKKIGFIWNKTGGDVNKIKNYLASKGANKTLKRLKELAPVY